nr:3-keto-5-aminohexanoate cleavage protein [Candidatus Freyarchaeota archaeon]
MQGTDLLRLVELKQFSSGEKLVITVTLAHSWIYTDVKNYPAAPKEIVDMACKCCEAGASIVHIHTPKGKAKEIVDSIREKCDIIIQLGMSSDPIDKRKELFDSRPDMLSVILNHHDECFSEVEVNQLHSRKELEEYCKIFRETGIKPEFENWHYGSVWNLNHLIKKNLLEKPYYQTLFFGWPGGTWSPPIPEEFFHRIRYLPEGSVYAVSIMGSEQSVIVPLSIAVGGHVRVGTEDYPFLSETVPAKSNVEIVQKTVKLSREIGREVADPSEARKILGI